MKTMRVLAGCALATLFALPAVASANWSVSVNLSNAPPPPVVVVQHEPRTVWLADSRVYVVSDPDFDDDYFQCGGYWYVYRNNYWYRARTWRGPYSVIEHRAVPHSIMVVPARHWKRHPHGGPPGLSRNRASYVEHRGGQVERVKVKSKGSSNGKGKGKH